LSIPASGGSFRDLRSQFQLARAGVVLMLKLKKLQGNTRRHLTHVVLDGDLAGLFVDGPGGKPGLSSLRCVDPE
jgi:hypothetical protein